MGLKLHLGGSGCRYTKSGYVVPLGRLSSVNCKVCQATPMYVEAKAAADAEREAAFNAQVPRQVREPWQRDLMMVCKSCGNDTFRHRGRSCMGHYDDHVCAACGGVESRLTETGMSF